MENNYEFSNLPLSATGDGENVFQKINKVTKQLSLVGIGKDRKNQAQGFNFRGIDDILNVMSGILSDAGLVIIPSVEKAEIHEFSKNNKPWIRAKLLMQYRLCSADDASFCVASAEGEAIDMADKATNKAMSAAYKYMAIQTFSIPLVGRDDPDYDPLTSNDQSSPEMSPAPKTASKADAKPNAVIDKFVEKFTDCKAVDGLATGIEKLSEKKIKFAEAKPAWEAAAKKLSSFISTATTVEGVGEYLKMVDTLPKPIQASIKKVAEAQKKSIVTK